MRISLAQSDIRWEDKAANLLWVERQVAQWAGRTDLLVLPEMFSTGFSMNPALAEPVDGPTMERLRQLAADGGMALAGSLACSQHGQLFNRAFLLTPEGEMAVYDKRHLFRMGGEAEVYSPGSSRQTVAYRGWNIRLAVCYDLRFPVWLRQDGEPFDLLLVVANWPAARGRVWDVLLEARAIENQCYVCGVNRVGVDGHGWTYGGRSALVDARGLPVLRLSDREAEVQTAELNREDLQAFRRKFPVWQDADAFVLPEAPPSA
ncbi:MAG: nitrilase-related carbon-nitrogen hydrolase [Bacteroidaceae bacterium]